MEWILQIVDEVDDALGALRQGYLGIAPEIGSWLAAVAGLVAMGAALILGAQPILLFCAVLSLCAAAWLKVRTVH